ncbi:hypothetical protein BS78_09G138900 [Paspalum vaginatum]|nr:hypothetical protein BS78_09G138900 [Paspalum vaginatum]
MVLGLGAVDRLQGKLAIFSICHQFGSSFPCPPLPSTCCPLSSGPIRRPGSRPAVPRHQSPATPPCLSKPATRAVTAHLLAIPPAASTCCRAAPPPPSVPFPKPPRRARPASRLAGLETRMNSCLADEVEDHQAATSEQSSASSWRPAPARRSRAWERTYRRRARERPRGRA